MKSRLVLLVIVGGVLASLYAFGVFELVTDRERFRSLIDQLGFWGPVAYVIAFALLEPFFVPGIAFMVPGALVFSLPELFVYSLLGATGAGIVGFSFARYVARDYVEPRLPDRMRAWDARLEHSGLRTVVLIRLTLFIAPPAHWLLGLSKVAFPTFVLGTLIGFVPGMLGLSWLLTELGGTVLDWLASRPVSVWWWISGVVLGGLVWRRWLWVRRRRAAALS